MRPHRLPLLVLCLRLLARWGLRCPSVCCALSFGWGVLASLSASSPLLVPPAPLQALMLLCIGSAPGPAAPASDRARVPAGTPRVPLGAVGPGWGELNGPNRAAKRQRLLGHGLVDADSRCHIGRPSSQLHGPPKGNVAGSRTWPLPDGGRRVSSSSKNIRQLHPPNLNIWRAPARPPRTRTRLRGSPWRSESHWTRQYPGSLLSRSL